eukprot:TRINITY_DN2243_c0_g1_i1.p1 TRINITY_DN2243_c0_g1~~TRINITY_DN2243_c0_g1_i1.p1  ORF type:complete len:1548 (-),score=222.98 TRINITY_DN2243_c0_g1_i1:4111-8754(-)
MMQRGRQRKIKLTLYLTVILIMQCVFHKILQQYSLNLNTMKEYLASTLDSLDRPKAPLETQTTEYEELVGVYEARIKSLYEQVGEMCENLAAEGGVGVKGRVREFVEKNLALERLQYVDRTMQELAHEKMERKKAERELEMFKVQNKDLARSLEQHTTDQKEDERFKLEKQIAILKEELDVVHNRMENELKQQEQKARSQIIKYIDQATIAKREAQRLSQEVDELKDKLEGIQVDHAKSTEQAKALEQINENLKQNLEMLERERNELYQEAEAFQSKTLQLGTTEDLVQKLQLEKDELAVKLKTVQSQLYAKPHKTHAPKYKLEDITDALNTRDSEISKAKRAAGEVKMTYEKIVSELHEEIKRLRDEHQHKDYNRELEFQREVSNMKSAHALELAKHDEDWEKICNDKIKEMEEKFVAEKIELNQKLEDVKTMHEGKLKELENNTVPLEKHYKSLEAIRKQSRNEKESESNRIKGEMQYHDKKNERKLNELKMENRRNVNEIEARHKTQIEEMSGKLENVTREKSEIEADKQRVMKEVKRKLEEIEDLEQSLDKVKQQFEDERKKRKETEGTLQIARKHISELEEDITRNKQSITQLCSDNDDLNDELKKHKEEKDMLSIKCRALENDIVSLENSFNRQLGEKKHEISTLSQTIEEQQGEIAFLHKTLQETREKDNQLIESEINKHLAVKKELLETEEHLLKLQEMLDKTQGELRRVGNAKKDLEDTVSEMGLENRELQRHVISLKEELEGTMLVHERTKEEFERTKYRVERLLNNKVEELKEYNNKGIKEGLKELKKFVQEYSVYARERIVAYYKEVLTQLRKEHEQSLSKTKNEANQTMQDILNDKHIEYTKKISDLTAKYEEVIKHKDLEIGHYQTLVDELNAKSKELNNNLEDLEDRLHKTQDEKCELEKANDELQKRMDENLEGFDFYKRDAEKQHQGAIAEINQQNADTIAKLRAENSNQLNYLYAEIEAIKLRSLNEVKRIMNDIFALKAQYQHELTLTAKHYEEKFADMEWNLTQEKGLVEKLLRQVDQLNTELDTARNEQRATQIEAEARISTFNRSSLIDSEKYAKLKVERQKEIDMLQNEVKQLRFELMNKNTQIEELLSDRDALKRSAGYMPLLGSKTPHAGSQTQRPLLLPQKDLPYSKNTSETTKHARGAYSKISRYAPRDSLIQTFLTFVIYYYTQHAICAEHKFCTQIHIVIELCFKPAVVSCNAHKCFLGFLQCVRNVPLCQIYPSSTQANSGDNVDEEVFQGNGNCPAAFGQHLHADRPANSYVSGVEHKPRADYANKRRIVGKVLAKNDFELKFCSLQRYKLKKHTVGEAVLIFSKSDLSSLERSNFKMSKTKRHTYALSSLKETLTSLNSLLVVKARYSKNNRLLAVAEPFPVKIFSRLWIFSSSAAFFFSSSTTFFFSFSFFMIIFSAFAISFKIRSWVSLAPSALICPTQLQQCFPSPKLVETELPFVQLEGISNTYLSATWSSLGMHATPYCNSQNSVYITSSVALGDAFYYSHNVVIRIEIPCPTCTCTWYLTSRVCKAMFH